MITPTHNTVDPPKPNLTLRFLRIACPFEAHPQRLQPLFKSTENQSIDVIDHNLLSFQRE